MYSAFKTIREKGFFTALCLARKYRRQAVERDDVEIHGGATGVGGVQEMNRIEHFGETQNVAVTVLVDNRADLMVKSTDTVIRFSKKPLLAEHGFAALIDLQDEGLRILWDAGISKIALLENMRRMEIDPTTIDMVALSHGHGDHTGAVLEILGLAAGRPQARKWDRDATSQEMQDWVEGKRVPLIAHPAVFRERWAIRRDGSKFGPHLPPSCAELESAGAQVILSEGPYRLGMGCATTGAIPRHSFEKAGTPSSVAYRNGDTFIRDQIDDDQALVINVKDKGLVIVAGCAHSGILNTVNYAREFTKVDKVWAVMGGFHLAPAKSEEIELTIEALEKLGPAMVVPTHCTGFEAIGRFAGRMPEQFVQGVVGTRYLF